MYDLFITTICHAYFECKDVQSKIDFFFKLILLSSILDFLDRFLNRLNQQILKAREYNMLMNRISSNNLY